MDLKYIYKNLCRCKTPECKIKNENEYNGIDMCTIVEKQGAKVIFLGRDPNPNSNDGIVGDLKNKRPKFHREIAEIMNKSNIKDKEVYVTNMLKCHWYCASTNKPKLEYRKNINNTSFDSYVKVCSETWLFNEIKALKPQLIVSFGEDNFIGLRDKIISPNIAMDKFSEAEEWQIDNGSLMKAKIEGCEFTLAVLRHPGFFANSDSIYCDNDKVLKKMIVEFIKNI